MVVAGAASTQLTKANLQPQVSNGVAAMQWTHLHRLVPQLQLGCVSIAVLDAVQLGLGVE